NGVINIITKKAEGRETAQTFRLADDDLTLSTGITHSMPFAAGDVRGYLRYSDRTNSALTGESTQRVWDDYRAGFRYDGIPAENHELLIEGDLQHSDFAQWDYLFLTAPPPGTPLTDSYQKSGNVLVRYSVEGADHSTTVQAYYDAVDRHQQVVNYLNRTLDVELRTVRVPGERWVLNLGGGLRRIADSFAELPTIEPDPADRVTYLWNAYSQAEFAARAGRLRLIAGAKIERSSTAGIHVSPTLRLSHRFAGHRVLWAGVSRAVSTPARTYEDIALRMTGLLSGGVPVYLTLRPGEDLVERVTAFEAGYRTPLRHWLSADVVTYLNRYDRLLGTITPPPVLTIEPGGARVDAEATWATGPAAETWGAELALEANRLGPISRLRLGYTYFRLAVGEEAPRYAPANPIGSSPTHQAFSNLTIPLPRSVELDTTLRYTSRLDKVLSTSIDEFAAGEFAVVEPYVTVDAQIRWNPLDRMHLAVGVRNLGGPDGPEFRDLLLGNSPHEVHESFYSLIRWEI
ncbi:MAG: TonB-dependent receptor, partial [Gemmatimonadetes bacterium]|nr:TonB-dependent receptor [Gemmatimonadota bacterium]